MSTQTDCINLLCSKFSIPISHQLAKSIVSEIVYEVKNKYNMINSDCIYSKLYTILNSFSEKDIELIQNTANEDFDTEDSTDAVLCILEIVKQRF